MDHIAHQLKKRLHQKKLTKQSAGAFVLHLLKKHVHFPEETTGKLVGTTFTLSCSQREDKTSLFHKRKELAGLVNQRLMELDYDNRVEQLRIV